MRRLAPIVAAALAPPVHADAPELDALAALAVVDPPVVAAASAPGRVEVESFVAGAGDPLVDLNSVTKTVTAVMVLHLVEAGRLSLDDPLGALLPNVPADKAAITVHQLLTHTAGIPDSVGSDEEALDRDGFLARVLAHPLTGEPGGAHAYSNAGYGLLAAVVEITTGRSYERVLLDDVLAPLGLPPIGYASVYDRDRSLLSARVPPSGFMRRPIDRASWGGAEPGWNLVGNGGLVTTAEGFVAFWRAFVEGRIVGDDLVALALTPHVDEGWGDTFYGYGLVVEPLPGGGTVYWHDGGNEAFSAEWRHFAPAGRTFFVAGPGESAFPAMDRLLGED